MKRDDSILIILYIYFIFISVDNALNAIPARYVSSAIVLLIKPEMPIAPLTSQPPDVVSCKLVAATLVRLVIMFNYKPTICLAEGAAEFLPLGQFDDYELDLMI
jgi:hypothetical protein